MARDRLPRFQITRYARCDTEQSAHHHDQKNEDCSGDVYRQLFNPDLTEAYVAYTNYGHDKA